ncbi:hypothetical protein BRC94_02730 [Halobacteriales archaeon QS_5_70_17]|nr:MAG: hypothetical protein BRC94_02730 [Halobacteriales archaeon QS_5_70_17]
MDDETVTVAEGSAGRASSGPRAVATRRAGELCRPPSRSPWTGDDRRPIPLLRTDRSARGTPRGSSYR